MTTTAKATIEQPSLRYQVCLIQPFVLGHPSSHLPPLSIALAGEHEPTQVGLKVEPEAVNQQSGSSGPGDTPTRSCWHNCLVEMECETVGALAALREMESEQAIYRKHRSYEQL